MMDAKIYEGEPYIDGRVYTRERTQEELLAEVLDEFLERKFEAMRATQAQDRRERESYFLTFLLNVISGVKKHGTVDE